uniref:EF-hand domain-containing protein n=1 Tax=Anthurium amnicola TaxID=1678845 RepID=A0A1D1YJD5_9ARAE
MKVAEGKGEEPEMEGKTKAKEEEEIRVLNGKYGGGGGRDGDDEEPDEEDEEVEEVKEDDDDGEDDGDDGDEDDPEEVDVGEDDDDDDAQGGEDDEDEDDDDDDVGGGGGEEDERLMAIEDVIAAVTEAGSPECVESLISAFEFYDRDGDGVISGSDLVLALRDAVGGGEGSEVPSAAACQEMVAAFDWGRAGGLCFDDFLRMMMVSDSCSSSGHQTDEQGT